MLFHPLIFFNLCMPVLVKWISCKQHIVDSWGYFFFFLFCFCVCVCVFIQPVYLLTGEFNSFPVKVISLVMLKNVFVYLISFFFSSGSYAFTCFHDGSSLSATAAGGTPSSIFWKPGLVVLSPLSSHLEKSLLLLLWWKLTLLGIVSLAGSSWLQNLEFSIPFAPGLAGSAEKSGSSFIVTWCFSLVDCRVALCCTSVSLASLSIAR